MRVEGTCVVIGSGPSLTRADCELAARHAAYVIAVNNSWELADGAHAVYAGDYAWWEAHHARVPIHLEKWTCSDRAAERFRLYCHRFVRRGAYNSGQRAIELALAKGFMHIVLLGFDCSVAAGRHWHADHPGGATHNPDAARCQQWQDQFAEVAADAPLATIVNASRQTELAVFPRLPLEVALEAGHVC